MLAISIITVTISGLLISHNQFRILEQSAVDKAQTQASLIAASIESAIIFNDRDAAKNTLQFLKNDYSVEFACIILPGKIIFAEYSRDSHIEKPKFDINTPVKFDDLHLDIHQEINVPGSEPGYILMRSGLGKLNQQREYYVTILISVLLLSVGIAFILSLYLRKIITSPLEEMAKHANDFCNSTNYENRLDIKQGGEFATLAKGFNQLLDVVQEREKELEYHGTQLQKIVDERTEQLYQKAHFDSLTGLANRSLLHERLEHAIKTAERNDSNLAILFLDLDRFKVINDSLGHTVGDQLLKAVSERLKKLARSIDTFSRLGGDEFVLLIDNIKSPDDPARIAQRVIDSFSKPFQLDQQLLHVSASVGISIYPADGTKTEQLLKNADISMYHSKQKGPGNYCFYNQDMNTMSFKRLEFENHIRSALENEEFYLVYQPQININTDSICKAEALIRWDSDILGFVPPNEFIPVAEEMGIINQIGIWVISEVCRQLGEWKKEGLDDVMVSVNISASHLMVVDIIDHIKMEIAKNDISFSQLELEITEDVFLDNSERTIQVLKHLQRIGIHIAIDDFGTGYSSLRYLQQFPVDTLKIDGMFIQNLENCKTSQGIVISTIALAQGLDLTLVAECVENKEQLDFLANAGCNVIQGYYFYKPLPQEEFFALLLDNQKLRIENK